MHNGFFPVWLENPGWMCYTQGRNRKEKEVFCMRKKKYPALLAVLAAAGVSLALAGCGQDETLHIPASSGEASQAVSSEESRPAGTGENPSQGSESGDPGVTQTAVLYIGMEGSQQEYPLEYTGELTPEVLIQGIAETTGWDLTLADAVTTGSGGMTVSFSRQSALFTGPPEPQKEEFHMFGVDQLAQTILDSIKATLQQNFVDTAAGGDPASLEIYYCMEGDQPLTIPGLEVTIPMDQPYTDWDSAVQLPSGA